MKKSRLFLTVGALLGILAALTGTREAQAANANFQIKVTIDDLTTHTSTTTTILNQGTDDTSTTASQIAVNASKYSGALGVSLTSLGATLNEVGSSTSLVVNGTATLNTTDTYTITVTATAINITSPAGGLSPMVSTSSGGNFSGTTASSTQTQNYTGYYNPNNTLYSMAGTTPGTQTILVPNTVNGNSDLSSNSPGTATPPSYITPYGLTDTLVLTLKGSNTSPTDVFRGTTTISVSSIPEPASVVMMLTGMPVPLIVLGMLRRRRKAAAKD